MSVGKDPPNHAPRNRFGCSIHLQTHQHRLLLVPSDRDCNYRSRPVFLLDMAHQKASITNTAARSQRGAEQLRGKENDMLFAGRLQRVFDLADKLSEHREPITELAVKELHISLKHCRRELEYTIAWLRMFKEAETLLRSRSPLGGPGSRVALMVSNSGNVGNAIAIASIYLTGNGVNVKLSPRGNGLMKLVESLYRPIFGDDVRFYRGGNGIFMEESLRESEVSAVVVIGFDEYFLQYERAFREYQKKLVFEGRGHDPFIVFLDAKVEPAVNELIVAKFMHPAPACVVPKRVYIHESLYEEFLALLVEKVGRLKAGDPTDEQTDIPPVVGDLAVERAMGQLNDAVKKGAAIVIGGVNDGNLICPTVVKNATDRMLGMEQEVPGPVIFTSSFRSSREVLDRARKHKYGLACTIFGGREASRVAEALRGEKYCHPVRTYNHGRFGMVAYNVNWASFWHGASVTKPVGGYGYSGWIWETVKGKFRIKQGPQLLSIETSKPS